jgi:hypothetical protein
MRNVTLTYTGKLMPIKILKSSDETPGEVVRDIDPELEVTPEVLGVVELTSPSLPASPSTAPSKTVDDLIDELLDSEGYDIEPEDEDPPMQFNNSEDSSEDVREHLYDLLGSFLRLNPSPSDEQFHALATSIGMDPAELESYAYEIMSVLFEDQEDDHDSKDIYQDEVNLA